MGMAVLSAVQLALLIFWAKPATPKTRFTVATAALTFALSLFSVPLSHLEHKRSIAPSAVLIIYLLFSVFFDIVRTRTLWSIIDNEPVAIIFSITLGIRMPLLIMESLEKRHLLKSAYRDVSLESTSSIIGQSMFWWANTLLKKGYNVVIFMDDLMKLDHNFTISSSGKNGLYLQWEKGRPCHKRRLRTTTFNRC